MGHYLDYAATSAVRPDTVIAAVTDFLGSCGATPGRGGHTPSIEAARVAFQCRRALMEVLGLTGDPGRIAFLQNATHGLNTALRGVLEPGDVVVASVFDHNSVLRPLYQLQREVGIDLRLLSGTREGEVDLGQVEALLEGARLLVVNSVSNVLGTRLPVNALAELARASGALVLVDAAQSAGHVLESLGSASVDMVAFTGHKGLAGPQGTGGLWVREGLDVRPLLRGGTGGDSARRDMPEVMPDRLEAGTVNSPGLAGLRAGCRFILAEGVHTLHQREGRLKARLREGFADLPSLELLSPAAPDGVGIVTVRSSRVDVSTLARRLDREFGIFARPGLHCAPETHRLLGTLDTGALRFSLGWASTTADVDAAVEALAEILQPTTVSVG